MQFQHLKSKKKFDREGLRTDLLMKLNNALKTNINNITIDKRQSIKIDKFKYPQALNAFFDVVKWYINTVREYYGKK